jgi:hypothetical protein
MLDLFMSLVTQLTTPFFGAEGSYVRDETRIEDIEFTRGQDAERGRDATSRLPGTAEYGEAQFVFPSAKIAALDPPRPEAGDRIEIVVDGAVTECYELMAIPGGQCFHYCDPARVLLRVFCREVALPPPPDPEP